MKGNSMLDGEYISLLGIQMGQELDAEFPNKIWNTSFHYGTLNWDRNIKDLVRDYDLTVRLSVKSGNGELDRVIKHLADKYNLVNPKVDRDAYAYYILEFNNLSEEQLLMISTLWKLINN